MKNISLIGYACGWGAAKRQCGDAPGALKKLGLSDCIKNSKWVDIFSSSIEGSEDNVLPLIEDYCSNLCESVGQVIKNKGFPVTLGGDHTMAIGTWSGVTKALDVKQDFGLIWFDAHMDSHTPQTSHSGSYHGMPLACILGHGESDLCVIGGQGAKIRPEHVCLIGVRSYEDEEVDFLRKLGVKVFFMDEVRSRGLEQVVKEALSIASVAQGGYGITIDIDVFDPSVAPGTGTLEPDGILGDETVKALEIFANDSNLKAIEIAEYNPNLDKDGVTFKLVCDILNSILTP